MARTFKTSLGDSVVIENWDWYTNHKICMWIMGAGGLNQLVLPREWARKIGKELIRLADKSKERKTKNVKRRTA